MKTVFLVRYKEFGDDDKYVGGVFDSYEKAFDAKKTMEYPDRIERYSITEMKLNKRYL